MTTSPVEADPGPVNTPAAPPAHVEIGARRWALATAALGVYILLAEIDRLVGMIPDERGHVWTFAGALTGLGRLPSFNLDQWEGFRQVLAKPGIAPLLATAYLVLDLLFVGLYGWVFLKLRDRSPLLGILTTGPGSDRLPTWVTFGRAWGLGACFDVVENLLVLLLIWAPGGARPPLWVCSVPTYLKWTGLFTGLGLALWKLGTDSEARACVARGRRAIYAQRYSILAVLPIAVLSLVPGGDIMDQLPDVQRRWLTAEGRAPFEEWHPWVAVVLLIVEALALFAMGRLVTEHEWRRSLPGPARPRARLWWWVIGPVLAGCVSWVTWCSTGRSPEWGPFGLFVGLPLVIASISRLQRLRTPGAVALVTGEPTDADDDGRVPLAWMVGDLLAVSVLGVGCLALVRSYGPVAVLGLDVLAFWGTVFGFFGAVFVWFLARCTSRRLHAFAYAKAAKCWWVRPARWLARELTPGLQPSSAGAAVPSPAVPGEQTNGQRVVTMALIIMGVGFLVMLCHWPTVTESLGVVGTALASLLGLSLLVGGSTVLHRQWEPPEALTWRPIRAKETPVASLMLLTITLGAFLGGTDLHLAQGVWPGVPSALTTSRVDLDGWFTTWRERQKGCTLPVGGSRVTPLLLVAAEGGGIRAAYWTAAVLDKLAAVERGAKSGTPESVGSPSAGCGAGQILLASGVSGGAVGLAVSRYAGQDGKAREQVKKLGQPGALSAASAGLFVRDWVAGATGIRYFSSGSPKWQDRAALMENAWVTAVPGLQTQFLNHPSDASALGFTASLLLNSTSVATGCRMIVSQVDLTKRSGQSLPKQSTPCGDVISPYGGSVDLLAQVGPDRSSVGPDRSSDGSPPEQSADQRCFTELTAATAAMFAARFPYVTPSGVVGPCGDGPMEQLIDGGYAEGTGLGTLTEVAPEIMRLIRDCNATAAAQGRPFIVPFVVYLDNGTGTGLATDRPGKTMEALVPPTGFLHNGKALVSTAALLQRLADITDPRGLSVGLDAKEIEKALGHRISVVHQWAKPAINAPLGWTLSQASVTTMDSAIEALAQCPTGEKVRSDPTVEMLNRQGYGRLYDVLKSLGADDCSP